MGTSPAWARGFIPTAQEWSDAFSGKADDLGYQYIQPVTGTTLSSPAGQGGWIIDPAGGLAAMTIILPLGGTDGQRFVVSTTQTIDALTVQPAGSQSLRGGGPFTLAQNGAVAWIFRLTDATWYPWA